MRGIHKILIPLMLLGAMALNGQQSGLFEEDIVQTWETSTSGDITLDMSPKHPVDELQVVLGGYLNEDIVDISIMNEVGLNIKTWEALNTKEANLELTELKSDQPYLLRISTSSGEILIERFVKA